MINIDAKQPSLVSLALDSTDTEADFSAFLFSWVTLGKSLKNLSEPPFP